MIQRYDNKKAPDLISPGLFVIRMSGELVSSYGSRIDLLLQYCPDLLHPRQVGEDIAFLFPIEDLLAIKENLKNAGYARRNLNRDILATLGK